MTVPEITRKADHATESLRSALHEPHHLMTVPDLAAVVAAVKPLTYHLEQLTNRIGGQLTARHNLGGLRHDNPYGLLTVDDEVQSAHEALDDLNRHLRAVQACVEDLHDALAHLADTGCVQS